MVWDLWWAFVVAAGLLILIPGPTILLVSGFSLIAGTRPALAAILGVILGDIVAMAVSFVGLGAVLAASAEAFLILKWLGAAYLIYLGIKQWRAKPELGDGGLALKPQALRAMMLQAFVVTALNPKGAIFFVAFLPQFVDPASPALPQFLLLGATFLALVLPICVGYVLLAAQLRKAMKSLRVLTLMNRAGGGLLIGAGLMTAALKRNG